MNIGFFVVLTLVSVYAILRLTLPHGPNGQHIHREYP